MAQQHQWSQQEDIKKADYQFETTGNIEENKKTRDNRTVK